MQIKMLSVITAVTTITKMVRSCMAAVPLNAIVGQPSLPTVQKLLNNSQPFVLLLRHIVGWAPWLPCPCPGPTKMRIVTSDANLNCNWLLQPNFIHPNIKN